MSIADTVAKRSKPEAKSQPTSKSHTVSVLRESPFSRPKARMTTPLPPEHTYGAASMQVYADGQVAYNTHASADGFIAYVSQFEQVSFRVKDTQVQWWQYDPTFDDWQSNFGCDSVEVFYHAGHGGTDASTGDYSAPLGGSWDNVIFLNSDQMSIGDQRLRYLFLATCDGCMVFAPNNPIRTWNVCNRGFSMVFGATGLIYDDPNYGSRFWSHWNSGISFSEAWQDCILDAGSSQQPATAAVGSSAADAQSRLFNERFFTSASANRAWYWWRWVGNAPAGVTAHKIAHMPKSRKFARVAPRAVTRESVLAAMKRHGFAAPSGLPDGPLDTLRVSKGDARFGVIPGGVSVEFGPATPVATHLTEAQARAAASHAIGGEKDLHLVAVLPAQHAGGPAEGDHGGLIAETYEHIAIYRQMVGGLPVLTPGAGEIRVHIDARGRARRIVDTRLEIGEARDSGPFPLASPSRGKGHTRGRELTTMEEVLAALHTAAARFSGGTKGTSRLIPDSVEFGLALRGTDLIPVARASVEIGKGPYKMFEVAEVDLFG
jgi:hypothetical protein